MSFEIVLGAILRSIGCFVSKTTHVLDVKRSLLHIPDATGNFNATGEVLGATKSDGIYFIVLVSLVYDNIW